MNDWEPPREVAAPLAAIGRERRRARTSDRVYGEPVAAIPDLRLPPGASVSETEPPERHVSRHARRALYQGPALRATNPGCLTE